jgi:hypothetical protein
MIGRWSSKGIPKFVPWEANVLVNAYRASHGIIT